MQNAVCIVKHDESTMLFGATPVPVPVPVTPFTEGCAGANEKDLRKPRPLAVNNVALLVPRRSVQFRKHSKFREHEVAV